MKVRSHKSSSLTCYIRLYFRPNWYNSRHIYSSSTGEKHSTDTALILNRICFIVSPRHAWYILWDVSLSDFDLSLLLMHYFRLVMLLGSLTPYVCLVISFQDWIDTVCESLNCSTWKVVALGLGIAVTAVFIAFAVTSRRTLKLKIWWLYRGTAPSFLCTVGCAQGSTLLFFRAKMLTCPVEMWSSHF
jgi:hypothetical protein